MNADQPKKPEELLDAWYRGALAEADRQALLDWLQNAEEQESVAEEMKKFWAGAEAEAFFSPAQKENILNRITGPKKSNTVLLRFLAAAAVLLLAVLGFAILFQQSKQTEKLANKITSPLQRLPDIVAPSSNKAVLTLADGRKIVLANANEGSLAKEGGATVRKLTGGQLVYEGSAGETRLNTLTVPQGSQPVHLTLADGSRVTLNVASSLTYPASFSGNSRRVTMSGEAYFEIAPRASAAAPSGRVPFVVEANGSLVEVKGTKFNVNAYPDEKAVRTTLLEGAVEVAESGSKKFLKPGQQAVVTGASDAPRHISIDEHPDLDEAMAWINGKFRFNNADAAAVMRQVARWYDVEVKFAARPHLRFGGQIDRNSTLRQMFTILETSGLHFSLEGKTVTILP